ncbi:MULTISPECIES: hypothetical protein [unclassified Streptomyces]|uniref:hypothetical protein n=1 Tax=unclassified Streptomyces TaxID=2593676 RepID=UPI0016611177|nr:MULTISPECIES: hypothetical protein [unclassified Streptomyces]MBD0708531.1 hypothetical protein [Streptomyces sp. CBMA291]MBD0717149.1 hypothetical protein [Streptomyces sp. CBMA370]
MSLLRALTGAVRSARPAPEPTAECVPDDDVLLDAPDERLAPALVAAAYADPEPAAKLLATTRDAREWEDRDRYVTRLATFAHRRDGWLTHWLTAAPRDPDALLVTAQLAVRRAWESPARAERLRELDPLVRAVAEAAPQDPVPWRLALDHARGAHVGHTVFESLWEQAVRRSPHHYGSHVAALKYLSAQWYGSHRAAFDFAEQAADDAAPRSLVRALPVRAAYDRLRVPPRDGTVPEERIDRAVDRGRALSQSFAVGDPWPAEVRNLLAHVLMERARWEEAREEFGRIGAHATSFPWGAGGVDPLRGFLAARDRTRREPARRGLWWGAGRGRAGRGGPGGH